MLRSFAGLKFKTEFLSNVGSAPVSAKTACWKEVCFVQIARNGLVTVVESIKVRLILTWHAQRWSKSRAAKHSPYFARLMEAEMAAARHKVEDSDSEEEEKHGKKVFKRQTALERAAGGSDAFGKSALDRYSFCLLVHTYTISRHQHHCTIVSNIAELAF